MRHMAVNPSAVESAAHHRIAECEQLGVLLVWAHVLEIVEPPELLDVIWITWLEHQTTWNLRVDDFRDPCRAAPPAADNHRGRHHVGPWIVITTTAHFGHHPLVDPTAPCMQSLMPHRQRDLCRPTCTGVLSVGGRADFDA